MAQLCTNAAPITNSALNGSHLHQCLLTHSECTQPTQIKCFPYTLRIYSTNSNQVLSLHTQIALNQLKSSALLTHSECTQPAQIKVLYELNVHKYTLMTQIKTYNVGMCTHAHPMLRNTSKEHQSSTCTPPNSRWPPKPQSSSKALQNSSKAPKAPPRTLQN
jgi:hypothetical protein